MWRTSLSALSQYDTAIIYLFFKLNATADDLSD